MREKPCLGTMGGWGWGGVGFSLKKGGGGEGAGREKIRSVGGFGQDQINKKKSFETLERGKRKEESKGFFFVNVDRLIEKRTIDVSLID
jgi:hypothetical protein